MILEELALCLDKIFNKNLALSWDKAGLQIGNLDSNIRKILVALDLTSGAANEAINLNSDLIVAHHPLIFNSMDTILSSGVIEKKILKLIENKIAVYCAHTNYDAMAGGLNDLFAHALGLTGVEIIEQQYEQWYKFVIFAPRGSEEKIRKAICSQGGGKWRNYSCCTFNVEGKGTFIPGANSKPYTGKIGSINFVDEVRIECIVNEKDLNSLVEAALKAHPYEEPAYDIYKIENKFEEAGIGRSGKLSRSRLFKDFAGDIKKRLEIDGFEWIAREDLSIKDKKISRVAAVCGSANLLTGKLAGIDCDVVVVGEIGYHNALQIAESGKIIIAVGHGNSEKLAINGISGKLEDFFKENKIKVDILKSKLGFGSWRYKV